MKQTLLSLLLTIMAAAAAFAQSESKAASSELPIERQLIELERQLSDALVREDAVVLDRLWSNDLVFTFPNGKVSNKAQRLAGQKPAAQPSQSESAISNDEENSALDSHICKQLAAVCFCACSIVCED